MAGILPPGKCFPGQHAPSRTGGRAVQAQMDTEKSFDANCANSRESSESYSPEAIRDNSRDSRHGLSESVFIWSIRGLRIPGSISAAESR